MKFCSNCGNQIADNALFCNQCGAECSVSAPVSDNNVVGKLKEIFSSKLVLVAAILVSVSVFFSLFGGGTISDLVQDSMKVEKMSYSFDDYSYYDDFDYDDFDFDTTVDTEMGAGINIMAVVLLISLWVIWANARNNKVPFMKTGGFKTLLIANRVYYILLFVLLGLLAVIGIAFSALAGTDTASELFNEIFGYGELSYFFAFGAQEVQLLLIVVGITLIIVSALLTVLFAFLFSKTQKTLKAIIETAVTGEPTKYVSSFVGVMLFIMGGLSAMNFLSYMVLDFAAAISAGCLGAAYILLGVVLFKLKNEMSCFVAVPVEQPFAE